MAKSLTKWAYWKRNQRSGKRAGRCAKCGSTSNLIVHHRNGEIKDNRPSALQTLCRACHVRMHPEVAAAGGRAS